MATQSGGLGQVGHNPPTMAGTSDSSPNGVDSPYRRNVCVKINVGDNTKVKAKDVIKIVSDYLGVESILGIVPKSGDLFEVNLRDRECVRLLCPEIEIDGRAFLCAEVVQDDVVVSILHLPTYVTDEQICERLTYYGVEVIGDVKRRKYPGTDIVDGTRYVRVRFPTDIKALPYTIKIFDGENWGYYRVIHNNQVKVCNNCLSDGHVYKYCPENECYKCREFGHLAKFCEAEKCSQCKKYGKACVCLCDRCGMVACRCSRDDTPQEEECLHCGRLDSDCECPEIEAEKDSLPDCIHCGKCFCDCNNDSTDCTVDRQDASGDDLTQRDQEITPKQTAVINTDHRCADENTEETASVRRDGRAAVEREEPVASGSGERVIEEAIIHAECVIKPSAQTDTQNISSKPRNSQTVGSKRSANAGEMMDTETSKTLRRKKIEVTPNISVARAFHKKLKTDDEVDMNN